jgi:tRNA pseudouridine13 synthase
LVEGPVSFRADIDDFHVEEVPLYAPSGEGEHLYIQVQKKGLSTPELVRRILEMFDLHEKELGFAGRKDARGITSQWLSVPARKVEERAYDIETLGEIKVLTAARHGNKLRLGHLLGNRFRLRLHGNINVEKLRERAERLQSIGMPNYFGEQRFGPEGHNRELAERFLGRSRRPKGRKERFWASVAQSIWFNEWLSERLQDNLWQSAVAGDVLMKVTGASFVCESPEVDTPRVIAGEVSPAGPLFGSKMRSAVGDALTRESRLVEHHGGDLEGWCSHPALDVGTRRSARVHPTDIKLVAIEGGVELEFMLPKGSYATVFIREILGVPVRDFAFVDGEN